MGCFKFILDVKCLIKEIVMLDEIKMIEFVVLDIIEVL